MTELINNHPTLAWIILFAACVAVVVACVALFNQATANAGKPGCWDGCAGSERNRRSPFCSLVKI